MTEHPVLGNQDVYNPRSGKVMNRTVAGITVKDGLKIGSVRIGKTEHPVYFSPITNRWCFA